MQLMLSKVSAAWPVEEDGRGSRGIMQPHSVLDAQRGQFQHSHQHDNMSFKVVVVGVICCRL
jgi:hypothetical protein